MIGILPVMSINEAFILIIMHFVFDWFLQPRAVAQRKASSWKWMGMHTGILYVGYTVYAWMTPNEHWMVIAYVALHTVQDKLIWAWYREGKDDSFFDGRYYATDPNYYRLIALDQMLHLLFAFWIFTRPVG